MSEMVGGITLKNLGDTLCVNTGWDCIDLDQQEVIELHEYLENWLEMNRD